MRVVEAEPPRLELDADEAEILRGLAGEMRALLAGGVRRHDPVIARLFPAAYEQAADERAYREMTEGELHGERVQALEDVGRGLGERGPAIVTLDGETVGLWLPFLTDLRLAIGTRLNVDEETMSAPLDPERPPAPALTLLHWLGWVQEEILRSVAR